MPRSSAAHATEMRQRILDGAHRAMLSGGYRGTPMPAMRAVYEPCGSHCWVTALPSCAAHVVASAAFQYGQRFPRHVRGGDPGAAG